MGSLEGTPVEEEDDGGAALGQHVAQALPPGADFVLFVILPRPPGETARPVACLNSLGGAEYVYKFTSDWVAQNPPPLQPPRVHPWAPRPGGNEG